MENEIVKILEKYNEAHTDIKCTFEEDMLSEIFKISMQDLKSNKKISTGIFEQCLELSRLNTEDIITYTLDEMYTRLKKNIK